MSVWMLIVAATAAGGALLLYHAVSQTKHVSEKMLDRYREMLADARKEKARQILKEAEEAAGRADEQVPQTEPIDTKPAE